jgi:hypothetical protein
VSDRTLTLRRHGALLRHDVDPRGAAAAWDKEIQDRVRALDDAGIPPAAGRDTIRAALTELWAGPTERSAQLNCSPRWPANGNGCPDRPRTVIN